jgi:hypothetical protein
MRPDIRGQFLASKEQGALWGCLLVNTAAPDATATGVAPVTHDAYY